MPEGKYIPALPLTPWSFVTTMQVRDELESVIPGRDFKKTAAQLRQLNPLTRRAIEEQRELHQAVQRTLSGAKLSNAKNKIPSYIRDNVLRSDADGPLGDLGASIICTTKQLTIAEGLVDIQGVLFVYGDGESRAEGELYFLENGENGSAIDYLLGLRRPFVVFHSVTAHRIRMLFGHWNGLGVPVTPNLLVARDEIDPFAVISQEIFSDLDIKLELEKRQVAPSSGSVFTALAARQLLAAMFHGHNVVAYGAGKLPTTVKIGEGEDVVSYDLDEQQLRLAGKKWISHLMTAFGPAAFLDKDRVLRSMPVLVSLGAIGRELYLDPSKIAKKVAVVLEDVEWRHTPVKDQPGPWDGVAGKRNAAKAYSVSSGKEAVHAVFAALTDSSSPGFARIRG